MSLKCHHIVVRLPSPCRSCNTKTSSRVATFMSTFIYQFNTFVNRVWFRNDRIRKRYILILFWLTLAHFWLRGVALKSRWFGECLRRHHRGAPHRGAPRRHALHRRAPCRRASYRGGRRGCYRGSRRECWVVGMNVIGVVGVDDRSDRCGW